MCIVFLVMNKSSFVEMISNQSKPNTKSTNMLTFQQLRNHLNWIKLRYQFITSHFSMHVEKLNHLIETKSIVLGSIPSDSARFRSINQEMTELQQLRTESQSLINLAWILFLHILQ